MRFRLLGFGLALGLAGCGGGPPPAPIVFKPIDFSYLPPITLRVANVNVQNVYVPGLDEATLIGEDPEAPANAISDLLNRRLIPSGAPGTANVTIEQASLDESGGVLSGTMAVRVEVATPDGRSHGYTEASVTHSQTAPDSNASEEDVRAALYGITKELVSDLNDRLQYQLQQNLGPWIVYGGGPGGVPVGGAAPGPIIATPLPGPGTPAAMPAGTAPQPLVVPTPGVATAPVSPSVTATPDNALPPGSLPLGTLPLGAGPMPSVPVPTVPMPAGTGVSQ